MGQKRFWSGQSSQTQRKLTDVNGCNWFIRVIDDNSRISARVDRKYLSSASGGSGTSLDNVAIVACWEASVKGSVQCTLVGQHNEGFVAARISCFVALCPPVSHRLTIGCLCEPGHPGDCRPPVLANPTVAATSIGVDDDIFCSIDIGKSGVKQPTLIVN